MTRKSNNSILIGCLCAIGCETIFGLSYVFTKQATNVATAFQFLGWRFLIAAIFMSVCILLGLIKVSFKGKNMHPLFLVAVCNPAIYYIGETIGISHTTAAESGVILASIPVASLVASTLILREKPFKTQIIGILITLIGVIITVFAAGAQSSLSVVGYLFLFIGVISYALYAVFVEKANAFTSAEITYIMMVTGALLFGTVALIEGISAGTLSELITLPLHETGFLVAILYSGICSSILGFILSNTAIALIGVNRTASFIGLSTVVAIIAGVLALGESFSVFQVIGAAVIIAGVYIANAKLQKGKEGVS